MKPLLPTLKERKRYILFKVISDTEIKKETISQVVHDACLRFLGEFGMANAGVQFLAETWNEENKTGIIRTGHKFVDHVKTSLALVTEIDKHKATFQTLKVSGIINKVKL